jgi:hypothetical protein
VDEETKMDGWLGDGDGQERKLDTTSCRVLDRTDRSRAGMIPSVGGGDDDTNNGKCTPLGVPKDQRVCRLAKIARVKIALADFVLKTVRAGLLEGGKRELSQGFIVPYILEHRGGRVQLLTPPIPCRAAPVS